MKKEFYLKLFQSLIFFFFVQGSTFLLNFYLIKVFSKSVYGIYAMILNTVILIGGIADLGIGGMASRFLAELLNNNKERAQRVLKLTLFVSAFASILVSALYFICSGYISQFLFGSISYKSETIVSTFILLFFSLNTTLTGILVGMGYFPQLAKVSAVGAIVYILLPFLLKSKFGILGVLLGVSISYLTQVIIMYILIVKSEIFKFTSDYKYGFLSEISLVYKYALPSMAGGSIAVFALWYLQYNLLHIYKDTKLIADYSVAFSIKTIVLMIPAVVNSVSLNFLNGLLGKDNSDYKKAFKLSNLITVSSTILTALFFAYLGKNILLIFGKQYQSNSWILLILLLATIPEAITISRSQILTSENKIWKSLMFINVPRDIGIFIIIGTVLIMTNGIIGACLTYLIARTYSMIAVYLLTSKSKLIVKR